MTLILRLLFNALGLMVLAYVISGIQIDGFYYAVIAAFILGILNLVVRPVLILLTIPLTIITLGLFALVINGALFLFAASFIEGFAVTNLWYGILGAIGMSIIGTIGNSWLEDK